MIRLIQSVKINVGGNTVSAIETFGNGDSFSLSMVTASLMNDPDLNISSDGTIALEFCGNPVALG